MQTRHAPHEPRYIDLFTPKLVTAFREGYGLSDLRRDATSGLTVAIVALPLAMAIGIASGTTPDRALITAVVGGFIISALGGSRLQIGGPTAAFIVVVFNVIERQGYDGLLLATIIAGVLLVAIGLLKLGTYIKYIPYPVITGFTSGIAVSIFASQIKDLLGLKVSLPGDFVPKIMAIAKALPGTNWQAILVAGIAGAIIVGLRMARPRWPGFLIAVVVGSVVVALLSLDVATIGSAFGGIPRSIPSPALPAFSLEKIRAVFPDAITIGLLAGIESLLSAVVADGMTGRRHRSNVELVAQGVANIVSALFGGVPATGAIARTATNIRSGARSPVSGMLHSAFLLVFILVAAPVLSYVPLAVLAAILTIVAWNISEFGHIRQILLNAPVGDRVVLVTTFLLTVLVDLTVAIQVGVVLAAILFMHRMANAVEIELDTRLLEEDVADDEPRDHSTFEGASDGRRYVVYRINGPFFFGATQKFLSIMEQIGAAPDRYILDFSGVPFVDSTGANALASFVRKARGSEKAVILAGVSQALQKTLTAFHIDRHNVDFADSVAAAVARANGEAS